MERREQLSPDRLFEASESVLLAVQQTVEARGACPYPPELLGDPDQPDCLKDYTRFEVEEATSFLVRLGVLQAKRTPGNA
ncbi:MAG: hypothetical protein IT439_07280 [Phycisphaerales bacterium]|nr:hypothetical protein [Phycisphaerales bacterium]